MSVVHHNLARHLHFMNTTSCAVGANGSPLDVVGQTTALGSFTVDHNFIVVGNLTVDCLLGADFMKYHAAILDCDLNVFSLGRESKVTIPIALKHHNRLKLCYGKPQKVIAPLTKLPTTDQLYSGGYTSSTTWLRFPYHPTTMQLWTPTRYNDYVHH